MSDINDVPRADIAEYFQSVHQYPGFQLERPTAVMDALDLWRSNRPLDFADCFHLALAHDLGMSKVYTFDNKMNRYPGVERVEP